MRKTWYICRDTNVISSRLAQKTGFELFGEAYRYSILKIGYYKLVTMNYSEITEAPGSSATKEQIARLYQRYHVAKILSEGKNILEAACGTGIGLSYLAENAAGVVGIDIDEKNVRVAQELYCRSDIKKLRIELMDVHRLDFTDGSFDMVLLFEAVYYLNEPEKFLREAERVLKENGKLIISTVNKDWSDFHPSPYTHRYYSVPELFALVKNHFHKVEVFGGFRAETDGIAHTVISLLKRTATRLHLIPGSLKTRAYLKRIFMGKLTLLPRELHDGLTYYDSPEPVPFDKVNQEFKIIYLVATK